MWKKLKSSMICWGNNMNDKRVGYFDILRIVSIFFVIVIHVTSVGLRLCETATPTWNVNWLLNSVSRWAVPVFFMVSGALFLEPSREITLKKLYKKSIFHIVVCIIVWGFFYSLLDQYIYGTLSAKSVPVAVYGIVTGNTGYHLWFLYTLVMLYIAVPLFRLITCHGSKRQLEYALVVWGVFSLLIGQINAFAAETGLGSDLLPYSPFVIAGYGGYFLLGYYLMLNPLKGKLKKACYSWLFCLYARLLAGNGAFLLSARWNHRPSNCRWGSSRARLLWRYLPRRRDFTFQIMFHGC